MNNEILFKMKCTDIKSPYLTAGKEYDVVEIDEGFYKVKNDSGEFWWYCNNRFQIVETPKDKQEIISELALQLLPTVYDKAIHITESDRFFRYEDWRNDIVAKSFKLAEAYYDYKEKYLKEGLQ